MTSPRHIPALTGIRAIAAGMVFYGHMLLGHMSEVPELMQYGWTGVNIFFALSGYLFTYLYSDKLFDGSFSWSDYIKRRIIRIYPLTSLLIIIAILSQWGEYSLGNIVTHLMLLHAWIPEYRLELISPMWTLSVEESFYFSAPVLIILLGLVFREVATHWSSVSKTYRSAVIILVAMALWLLILSFSAGATKLYQNTLDYYTAYWDNEAWTFTIFGRIVDFASGMLAASIARYVLPRRHYIGDIIVLAGALLYVGALSSIADMGGPNNVGSHRLGLLAQNSVGLAAAIIIYGLHAGGLFSRLLSSKPMQILGEASFALYLIQLMPFLWWPHVGMQIQYNMEDAGFNFYTAATVSYIVINIVSIGVFYMFERPVSRFLRRRFLSAR